MFVEFNYSFTNLKKEGFSMKIITLLSNIVLYYIDSWAMLLFLCPTLKEKFVKFANLLKKLFKSGDNLVNSSSSKFFKVL